MHKVIIQGKLELGSQRTFDQVAKMLDQRLETYYKNDIMLDAETLLNKETLSLDVPRKVAQVYPKTWKNTINMLEFVSQFGVAGSVAGWKVLDGKILEYVLIEPSSDKAVVQHFKRGQNLSKEAGKEKEALNSLNKAIDKYNTHSQAYEYRGYINYKLKEYDEAMRDFTKSIKVYDGNASAYFGRARIHYLLKKYPEAIEDLENCLKKSLALQNIYWEARRLKASAHLILGENGKAEFDLKFFNKRTFTADSPNYKWRKWALFHYGKLLFEKGSFEEALHNFDQAISIAHDYKLIDHGEIYYYRGLAKQSTGGSGFISDWKEAAKLGLKKAKQKLKELS